MIAGRRVFRFPIAQRRANIDTYMQTCICDAWMGRAQRMHLHIHTWVQRQGGRSEVAPGERSPRSGGGGGGSGCRGRQFHRLALLASSRGKCEQGPWTLRWRRIPVFMVTGKRAVSLNGRRIASSTLRNSRSEMIDVTSLISIDLSHHSFSPLKSHMQVE